MNTHMMHTEFPTTGQPIRVVIIDGGPWFVVADICRILGIGNARMAARALAPDQRVTVDLRKASLNSADGMSEAPAQQGYTTGNPRVTATNESGLHTLVMRSRKPNARPFQDWVTRELLPSVRRGDTFEVRDDGSVHCPHGRMRVIAAVTEDELEPPFGPSLLCAELERVGIRRHKAHRPCGRLLFTSVLRHLPHRSHPPLPEADITVSLGAAQLHGKPAHIAEVLHRLGMTTPAY